MIIHGTKKVEQQLGWVADFCTICRQPRASRLFLLGMKSHLYFVGLGALRDTYHEIECSECKTRSLADPARYLSVEKKRPADFTELAAATMSDLPSVMGDRLVLEKTIRESPGELDVIARQRLLFEPFQILNLAMDKQTSGGTHLDAPAGIGCVGTMVLGAVLLWVSTLVPYKHKDNMLLVMLGGVGLGVLYTLIQVARVPVRKMRKEIIPKLVGSIGPLKPTEEEINAVLVRCKAVGMQIGKSVKLPVLWSALEQGR